MGQLQAIAHRLQITPHKALTSPNIHKIEYSQGLLIVASVMGKLVNTIKDGDGHLCD